MPQIKRREVTVKLPSEYEGFEVTAWVNAPAKLWAALADEDQTVVMDAVSQIVLAHNDWRDFDGEPYPPADDPEFWQEIPTELAACVLMAVRQEMERLPNSLAPQRRRSRRG